MEKVAMLKVRHHLQRYSSWYATAVPAFYIVAFSIHALITGVVNSVNFNGYAADGAFQIYNPLRRLAAGQVIGRDFQFFHGDAIPLLHYPLFELLGANLFASEMSRWIVGTLFFLLGTFVFFYAAFRNIPKSFIATATTLYITVLFVDILYPSNSLIGLRTTAPLFFGALYLLPLAGKLHFRQFTFELRLLLLGALAGIAVLMGTEQGLAVMGAFCLLELIAHRRTLKTAITPIVQFLATGILTVVGLLSLLTLGHPLAPLKYALFEIPQDQSWYFGTPPQHYLNWHNLFSALTTHVLLLTYALTAAVVYLILMLRRKNILTTIQAYTGFFFITYGAIATLIPAIGGGFSDTQAIPLTRSAIVMVTWLALTAIFNFAPQLQKKLVFKRLLIILCASYAVIAIGAGFLYLRDTKKLHVMVLLRTAKQAVHKDDYFVAGAGWKANLDSFKITNDDTVWATYSTLYESQAGIFNPSADGHDYVIHALGQDRRNAYQGQFITSSPKYAITLKPSYFPFEEWLWARDWPVYHHLLLNYDLVRTNGSHYLWQHHETLQDEPEEAWQDAALTGTTATITPTRTDSATFYEVKVDYEADALLPLTNSLPRYLLEPQGSGTTNPVGLPPYETSWQFPVSYFPGGDGVVKLRAKVDGLFPGSLKIKKVQFRQLALSAQNSSPFIEDYCYRFHDGAPTTLRNEPVCSVFPKL